jgi:outer membrane protein assembly factor BamB
MPLSHRLTLSAVLVAITLGCGGPSTGTSPTNEPPPEWDPPTPAQDGGCPASRTLCGTQCVDPRDPDFGCGSCTPCVIPRGRAKCEAAGPLYACSVAKCEPGYGNCNRFPSDGCEASLADDAANCGACGTACQASGTFIGVCKASVCGTACAAGTNLCGGACVPESPMSCGASCTVCQAPPNGTPTCAAGACDFTCNAGFSRCATGCCSACGDTAGLQAGAPWPTEGRCPTRIGRAVAPVAATLRQKWSFTGAWPGSSPAIAADGTLYFASARNNAIYALNADGSQRWQTPVQGIGLTTPTIAADGTIYVGVRSTSPEVGRLVALSSAGAVKWSLELGADVGAPIVAAGGTIYVGYRERNPSFGSYLPKLAAVSPAGVTAWTVAAGASGAPYRAPRTALGNDGTIYVAGGRLVAVAPSGTVKWSYPGTDAINMGAPLVTPGDAVSVMIQGSSASYVFARVDGAGAEVWKASGPLFFDDNLPVSSGMGRLFNTGAVMSAGYRIFEISATGATSLSAPAPTGSGAGTALGNPVLDGADSMVVYTMSKVGSSTRHELHTATSGGRTSITVPALEKWQPTIGADGTVYVVGTDGALYAFGS